MTKAEELLACPFCKSSDLFVEREDFTSAYVMCNACGARGPTECQDRDDEEIPGEAAARRIWNTRLAAQADAQGGDIGGPFERVPTEKLARHFNVTIEQVRAVEDVLGFMYRQRAAIADGEITSKMLTQREVDCLRERINLQIEMIDRRDEEIMRLRAATPPLSIEPQRAGAPDTRPESSGVWALEEK